jgi:ATP-binding cassette subfamily B protein
LLENIVYSNTTARREEVERAAWAAGLGSLLSRLPNGLDTVAGERGLTLSTGERQRVAIARAFLANPEVVILDEPSAALDAQGELDLLHNLRRQFAGKTVLAITHKPALAIAADHVLRLEHGRLLPQGVAAA